MSTNGLIFKSSLHEGDEFLLLTLSGEVLRDFGVWVSAHSHECALKILQHGLTLVCHGAMRRRMV
jgi:hypothetical protein